MNFKNTKNLLLVVVAVLVIVVSFIIYSSHNTSPYSNGSFINLNQVHGTKIVESIDIQNNVLINYFNSLYGSQVSDIDTKYNDGLISSEERDKQLNAVIKNRELTVNTINKLSDTKKYIFMGNITKQDILLHINSFSDFNSEIKSEINATLNGN
jgi:hypothetical protein